MIPLSQAFLYASLGGLLVVLCFSLSIAATYRDRSLLWHGAATALAMLLLWQQAGALADRLAPALLLVLAATALQAGHLMRAALGPAMVYLHPLAGVVLSALAVCATQWPVWPQALGLGVFAGLMVPCLWRAWPRSRPWVGTAAVGYAWLVAAAVAGQDAAVADGPVWPAALVPVGLLMWSGHLYMASVWRHRRNSDLVLVQARERLLAMLGHDLRNPLQTIAMTTHALAQGPTDPNLVRRLNSSAARMEKIISDVVETAWLRNAIAPAAPVDVVDLRQITDGVVQDTLMAQPNARIEVCGAASVPVYGHAGQLAQLVDNLLGNALRHGLPGHSVRVQLQGGERAWLEVRNHAKPIPAALVEQLFQPFKSLESAGQARTGGLGLGLFIAHEIARRHQGSLSYRWEAPEVVFAAQLLPAAAIVGLSAKTSQSASGAGGDCAVAGEVSGPA